jgi:hypothetical protein
VQAIVGVFVSAWNSNFLGIQTIVKASLDIVWTTFTTILEALKNFFLVFMAIFRGDWEAAWTGIKNFFSGIFTGIKTILSTFFTALGKIFSSGGQAVSAVWNGTMDAIGAKVVSVFDGVKEVIKNSINWMVEKINSVIRLVNSATSKLPFGGVTIPQIPNVAFANGGVFNGFGMQGIVNSPVMGVAGEAGPEAIVPLPDGRSIPVKMNRGGGGNIYITLNIQGSVQSERDLADTVSRVIAKNISSKYYTHA